MRRTSSTWGKPPSRYFGFLARVERQVSGRSPSLLVVGCADGKFVLPAARRGWSVTAIDVDTRMIAGCDAEPGRGILRKVPGLLTRLEHEGLLDRVNVRCEDFMTADLPRCDALWTSGALQYSLNIGYTIEALTDRLGELVVKNGFVYIEYMLPNEPRLKGRPNCPPATWWRNRFPERGWKVLRHSLSYREPDAPHPYAPWPHVHSWGRVLAIRAHS